MSRPDQQHGHHRAWCPGLHGIVPSPEGRGGSACVAGSIVGEGAATADTPDRENVRSSVALTLSSTRFTNQASTGVGVRRRRPAEPEPDVGERMPRGQCRARVGRIQETRPLVHRRKTPALPTPVVTFGQRKRAALQLLFGVIGDFSHTRPASRSRTASLLKLVRTMNRVAAGMEFEHVDLGVEDFEDRLLDRPRGDEVEDVDVVGQAHAGEAGRCAAPCARGSRAGRS